MLIHIYFVYLIVKPIAIGLYKQFQRATFRPLEDPQIETLKLSTCLGFLQDRGCGHSLCCWRTGPPRARDAVPAAAAAVNANRLCGAGRLPPRWRHSWSPKMAEDEGWANFIATSSRRLGECPKCWWKSKRILPNNNHLNLSQLWEV